MASREIIFWEVDTQRDFMLPGGKLYVPGAEMRIPNMRRLVDAARAGRVLLVSDACVHAPDDPEFAQFPPHCVRGTEGAEIVPELLAERHVRIASTFGARLPEDPFAWQQIVLEKHDAGCFHESSDGKIARTARTAPIPWAKAATWNSSYSE